MASAKDQTRTNPKEVRLKKGINQSLFWNRIGVTQSGGSRYESGRPMPKPVQLLFDLAYGDKRTSKKALAALRPDMAEGGASA